MHKPLSAGAITVVLAVLAAGCASKPQVTSTQTAATATGAPYGRILVITLFDSFDVRRYLEKEIVKQLEAHGVEGVAMTSMTDTRTIIDRDTVVDRVTRSGADAVLVTQLVSFESRGKVKDARPEDTIIFRPTYYYNVWSVQQTEYVEPPYIQFTDELSLASELYSAESREQVWVVSTEWTIKEQLQPGTDYSLFVEEARAIVGAVHRDGLISD